MSIHLPLLLAYSALLIAIGLWVGRRVRSAEADDRERLRLACELSWSRLPSAEETERATAFIRGYAAELTRSGATRDAAHQAAWTSYARILLTANEFFYLD